MTAKRMKSGFTMIEMLVVIGIIAILSGALLMGFGRITKTAQRPKAQETVSNAAAALSMVLQKTGMWPADILAHQGDPGPNAKDNGSKGMTKEVAAIFAKYKLMGVTCKNWKEVDGDYTPIGTDRYGIVDPWAVTVLKKGTQASEGSKVPTGGTVASHIVYYAVDEDGDGIVGRGESVSVCGSPVAVRASAIAWSAGADGVLSEYAQRGRSDDVFSWRKAQETTK